MPGLFYTLKSSDGTHKKMGRRQGKFTKRLYNQGVGNHIST